MGMSAVSYRNINSYNRWGIIISSGLMAITLIISWVLWIIFFRTNIDEVLIFLIILFKKQGIEFNFTFQFLTIIVLIFAVITLILITMPFLFLNKYGVITLVLTLLTIVLSIVVVTGSTLLLSCSYQDFYDFIVNKEMIDTLIFILPWALTLICCLLLFLFCLPLVIGNLNRKLKKEMSLADANVSSLPEIVVNNNEQSSPFSEQSTRPVFTERLTNEPDRVPQGINIVINNTGGGQLPQTRVIDVPLPIINSSNSDQINNKLVNNNEFIWTPQQIEEVWSKGAIITGYDPQLYRKDYAGALMFRNSFLNNVKLNDDPKSYNWTISYQRPLFNGGTADISNLQPMNNTNAITKGNNYPRWKTTITFNGKQNILRQKSWKDKGARRITNLTSFLQDK